MDPASFAVRSRRRWRSLQHGPCRRPRGKPFVGGKTQRRPRFEGVTLRRGSDAVRPSQSSLAARPTVPVTSAVDLPADAPHRGAVAWFGAQGWTPFAFQREVWAAMAAGRSGLLHANTGSGKTYAVWIGALQRALTAGVASAGPLAPPLGVLWITPMRALASDTTRALQRPLPELAPAWTVGQRTGDTPAAERARQDRRLPSALVTTPESLSLMLTRERAATELAGVHTVIVDEWHELIGNKRGVQVQLALARLRRWNPGLSVWGLSATLGNLDEAMRTLCGEPAVLVQGRSDKRIVIDTLLPQEPGRFSWGGHLGAQMQQPVVEEIERTIQATGGTTLVFTNVRSQAEIWYQLLLAARPDWAGQIALHHGSLDRSVREWVEAGLKDGSLKAVVATSSLDLGVDFLPVERVLQIGSPKGVARLLQRAGRSGHAPGRVSRVTLVPTNTLELVEAGRVARIARQAAGRAGPAPGDGGAGWRLRRRRAVRRSAQRACLPPARARGLRLGAGLRRARRRQPGCVPAAPSRRAR